LLLTLSITLVILGAAQYQIFSTKLSSSFVRAGETDQRADARSLELAYDSADEGEQPFAEVREVLTYISGRAQVNEVALVDARGVVVEGSERDEIGEVEEANGAIARSGGAYAGLEREAGERKDNFEYVRALRLGGRRYALEVDEDGAPLRAQISDLKRESLVLVLAGLLLAIPLFFLVGGRQLTRLHNAAVERGTRDGLTDLGNQTEFQEELRRRAAVATRYGEPLSLGILDVDDFKLANDRNGHRHGDGLLVGVASLLRAGRAGDRAFRIGGDEFALVMPHTTAEGAATRLNELRAAAVHQLGGVTLSCGVAELDVSAPDAETLVEEADAALYDAKRLGRDRVVCFSDLEDAQIVMGPHIRILHELLAGDGPEVAFQPVWELGDRDNRLLGYEALARPDTAGRLSPGDVFQIAERIGRGHELDALCRRATLARAHELPAGTLLFLNISPQSLGQDELAGDRLARTVRAAGLEPERVVLEITERATAARLDRMISELTRLRGLGFKLALDDVGAGNAGLEMLRKLPVDYVKIDREVIVDSAAGGAARAVLLAVISFAAELGAYVIAEGIETEAMLKHIRDPARSSKSPQRTGVQGAQGFLLGRPSTAPLTGAAVSDTFLADAVR
jgi:diguanylate cyclase (GGDEF)-like protein